MTRLLSALLPVALAAATACGTTPGRDGTGGGGGPGPAAAAKAAPGAVELARLNGQYVQALQIGGGPWAGVGPGQVVEITFAAEGLVGVGQFDVTVAAEGSAAIDTAGSQFVPATPFVTLGNGLEKAGESALRFVGANLARSTNGTAALGTLRLRMPQAFRSDTPLRLTVTRFSVGPSSHARDTYTAAQLGLGAVINGP
jgi:hypothetical protein